jgi:hypothetical protein
VRAPGVVLFLQPVANPIDRLDQIKGNVDLFELFAQTFDVTIDCAILDIDAVIISSIHEASRFLKTPGRTARVRKIKNSVTVSETGLFFHVHA